MMKRKGFTGSFAKGFDIFLKRKVTARKGGNGEMNTVCPSFYPLPPTFLRRF